MIKIETKNKQLNFISVKPVMYNCHCVTPENLFNPCPARPGYIRG